MPRVGVSLNTTSRKDSSVNEAQRMRLAKDGEELNTQTGAQGC